MMVFMRIVVLERYGVVAVLGKTNEKGKTERW